MKDKFYNKNGSLTAYSFRCGHVERKNNFLTLDLEGVYNIRCTKSKLWLQLETLTNARLVFKKLNGLHRKNLIDSEEAINNLLQFHRMLSDREISKLKLWGNSN